MALTLWHKFAELVTQTVLGYDYKLTPQQFSTLFFFIMSKTVILSMLAQGNTGDEILSILDVIVSDIEQEGIDSCAEVFEGAWLTLTVRSLSNTEGPHTFFILPTKQLGIIIKQWWLILYSRNRSLFVILIRSYIF